MKKNYQNKSFALLINQKPGNRREKEKGMEEKSREMNERERIKWKDTKEREGKGKA